MADKLLSTIKGFESLSSGNEWGGITGDIEDQADLAAALDAKANADASNVLPADWQDTVNAAIALDPAASRTALAAVGYNPESTVVVDPSGTDTNRGTALAAAYTAAKALTPNGSALSAANRATVIIPPGAYKVASTLVMDADFVDIVAAIPKQGGFPTNDDVWMVDGDTSLEFFRPPASYVYSDESGVTVVSQTVRDVRLVGFGIAQLFADGSHAHARCRAFELTLTTDTANDRSVYNRMYFWHRHPYHDGDGVLSNSSFPTGFAKNVAGTWTECIDGFGGMRVGLNGLFTANMFRCVAGPYSIGGDSSGGLMGPCRLEWVKCIGSVDSVGTTPGVGCFGGCADWGIDANDEAWFVECEAGYGSFNVGANAGGNYIRCRVNRGSLVIGSGAAFGSSVNIANPGEFSGYAEDCYADCLAFGAGNSAYNNCTGVMVRTTVQSANLPFQCTSATIRDCNLQMHSNGTDGINLLDSSTVISGTRIFTTGVGIPINASTAMSVTAANCTFDIGGKLETGLGGNVTNLAKSPRNSVLDAPDRVIHCREIIEGSWFSEGTGKVEKKAAIPLSTLQAVVGTKIRLAGKMRVWFNSTFPDAVSDFFWLGFAATENSGVFTNGICTPIPAGSAKSNYDFDLILELVAGSSGKFAIQYAAETPFGAFAVSSDSPYVKVFEFGSDSFVFNAGTNEGTIGIAQEIAIELHAVGSALSLCDFTIDLASSIIE